MKKLFTFLFICCLFSCSNTDNNDQIEIEPQNFLGEWELKQYQRDLGNGDIQLFTAEPGFSIEFFDDGTFTSKGEYCLSFYNNPVPTEASGTFSIGESWPEYSGYNGNGSMLIYTEGNSCSENVNTNLEFYMSDRNLILTNNCVEGCQMSFQKVQ